MGGDFRPVCQNHFDILFAFNDMIGGQDQIFGEGNSAGWEFSAGIDQHCGFSSALGGVCH
jgi:hypothetical protein